MIMCHSCNVEFSSMDLLTAHNVATPAEYALSAIVYPKKTAQLLTKNVNAALRSVCSIGKCKCSISPCGLGTRIQPTFAPVRIVESTNQRI